MKFGCKCLVIVLGTLLSVTAGFAAERRTPVVDAVSRARSAVVNIRTEQVVQRRGSPFFGFGDSLFEQFFEEMLPPRSYRTQSLGSGVIIDDEGHILTNAHVVDKASEIFVALPDKRQELEARLIGQDNRIDLAVLKIVPPGPYPFLPPGDSDDLLLGETVIAIGNPLGLGHSITTGIVSSQQRRIRVSDQQSSVFIQTDALINPGNSGGPLININGELIGINTAIARQAQGIGFSIPINIAQRVLSDLIEYGRVRPGFSGLVVSAVNPAFVESFGAGGVLVERLLPDSPAAVAGLQEADVILAVEGTAVASPQDYLSLLRTYTAGDRLSLDILRGVRELQIELELEPLPEGYELEYVRRIFGFALAAGGQKPVVREVVSGSPADRVGLRPGDLIAGIEGVRVADLQRFEDVIGEHLGQIPLTFTVVRDNFGYRIQLP